MEGTSEKDQAMSGQAGQEGAAPDVSELLKAAEAERDEAVRQSRKWEERSKANAEKARKYDELAARSMSDAERAEEAVKRADEAERRLAEYEAEAQRAKDAAEVAEKYGVPASLITEREKRDMERQAKAIKAFAEGQPSAQVFDGDGSRPGKAKQSKEAQFADFFQSIAR